jgi:hypothetical protein
LDDTRTCFGGPQANDLAEATNAVELGTDRLKKELALDGRA